MSLAAGELVARVAAGDVPAAARLMSWAERGDPRYAEAAGAAGFRTGRAWRVGLTGSPGAGKSTLALALVRHWRAAGKTLGLVAVDPSSPFSGGALLGDRVRLGSLAEDRGLFVRSLATRGASGGLCAAADDVADVLDCMGRDVVLLETVGVGQGELDVAGSAELVVVVLQPGAGDSIQALKAGVLEIADLFAVNKSDLPGWQDVLADLEEALDLRRSPGPRPPVLAVSAARGDGIAELARAIEETLAESRKSGRREDRRRALQRQRGPPGAREQAGPPRVLVAKPGLDGHDRGAKVVAAALRDAGMEVIYAGLHQTPEAIVAMALQEDVDVVGLSVLSGAHLTLFPRVRRLLDGAGATSVLLTGGGIIPAADVLALQAQGVGQLFGPGSGLDDLVAYIRKEVALRRATTQGA